MNVVINAFKEHLAETNVALQQKEDSSHKVYDVFVRKTHFSSQWEPETKTHNKSQILTQHHTNR